MAGLHPLPATLASTELAALLGLEHMGTPAAISSIAAAPLAQSGSLTFGRPTEEDWRGAVWIGPRPERAGGTVLVSNNPRLDFIRALHLLRDKAIWPPVPQGNIAPSASIDASAVVGAGVRIGADCRIGPHAVLHDGVVLGEAVTIGAGTVVGHPGFGYERLEHGRPLHFPHLGGVLIEDGVYVGNLCSISRGTLEDTIIGSHSKIDDQCYIAHNVRIGENGLIMSGVRLNGRVSVGERCWLGTGALIREGGVIGAGSTIGMGAVVLQPVAAGSTVTGSPARVIRR